MLTHNGMMTQQEQAGMGVLNIIKRSSPMLLANSHSFTEVLNLRAYDISPTKSREITEFDLLHRKILPFILSYSGDGVAA